MRNLRRELGGDEFLGWELGGDEVSGMGARRRLGL
jgi:hypothetical protein